MSEKRLSEDTNFHFSISLHYYILYSVTFLFLVLIFLKIIMIFGIFDIIERLHVTS